MLTLQQMLDIASRHATAMAAAMVAACMGRALRTGEPIVVPEGASAGARGVGNRPAEQVDWRRMVERNADTRWLHT